MKTSLANALTNPRISPLTVKYECPQLSLLIITSDLETNKIEPAVRSDRDAKTEMHEAAGHAAPGGVVAHDNLAYRQFSNVNSRNFKLGVSNPRTTACLHFKMPFEVSNLRGTVPFFQIELSKTDRKLTSEARWRQAWDVRLAGN